MCSQMHSISVVHFKNTSDSLELFVFGLHQLIFICQMKFQTIFFLSQRKLRLGTATKNLKRRQKYLNLVRSWWEILAFSINLCVIKNA